MAQIIPDIINIVVEAIFAILGLFFTGVAIPWLVKTGIPWLKDKRLYGMSPCWSRRQRSSARPVR